MLILGIMDVIKQGGLLVVIVSVVLLIGIIAMLARWWKKAKKGQALVRTGKSTKVSFNGMIVVPVLHRLEVMDISLKTLVISRIGKDGLVCKDNMRADIKVTFFIRVNENKDDVIKVAQSVGCERASHLEALSQLFEAKFSEALKTVGKRFDFVQLYDARDELRKELIEVIGTQLNGYILDDAAIDYLEQTPIESLDNQNILDSEGIKKIIDLTSAQQVKANLIQRSKEKTIKQQDVEAREAILELERQLAETEEKQKREVQSVKAREEAETAKVQSEERNKAEQARIAADEQIQVALQNKQRQIIVAERNKDRTNAVETERVEKDRLLEVTERERIVTLAQIEKEKAIEVEKKAIQDVIRERVAVEKTVAIEEEKIKDTRAFALADREKSVAITKAEEHAEAALVEQIKAADAGRQAAEFEGKKLLIDADAKQQASLKEAEAIKTLADAEAAKHAALGISEAQVMEAKAAATQKQGEADASVIEDIAGAEAKGITLKSDAQAIADKKLGLAAAEVEREQGTAQADVISLKATAEEKKGLVEAKILYEKLTSEAKGIADKAEAMKKLDGIGKDHEEFKLKLDKEKQVELAAIHIRKDIADAQAQVISAALESAKIDIVGGDGAFFDKITSSITHGKMVDRTVYNSDVLTELSSNLLDTSNGGNVVSNIKNMIKQFGITSEDLKNFSVSALLMKMMNESNDAGQKGMLGNLLDLAKKAGLADKNAGSLGL